jgi:hypothetical protein
MKGVHGHCTILEIFGVLVLLEIPLISIRVLYDVVSFLLFKIIFLAFLIVQSLTITGPARD